MLLRCVPVEKCQKQTNKEFRILVETARLGWERASIYIHQLCLTISQITTHPSLSNVMGKSFISSLPAFHLCWLEVREALGNTDEPKAVMFLRWLHEYDVRVNKWRLMTIISPPSASKNTTYMFFFNLSTVAWLFTHHQQTKINHLTHQQPGRFFKWWTHIVLKSKVISSLTTTTTHSSSEN